MDKSLEVKRKILASMLDTCGRVTLCKSGGSVLFVAKEKQAIKSLADEYDGTFHARAKETGSQITYTYQTFISRWEARELFEAALPYMRDTRKIALVREALSRGNAVPAGKDRMPQKVDTVDVMDTVPVPI